MSVQFGKCNFDGKPVDSQELDWVRAMIAPYGPDGEGIFQKDQFAILSRAFHTNKESRLDRQPHVSPLGEVLTWDGRLDNRSELIHALGRELSRDSTDLSIVIAAYEHWRTDSFAKLIGDWALSIWDPRTQSLILAKDFIGTRQLYYLIERDQVTWCTILDPLVLLAGRAFPLCNEYIAGWLSFLPASHLTPYVGIEAVPPSYFVVVRHGIRTLTKYWDFDPNKTIHHPTDSEYEEHFRSVFAEAVKRRLRSDSPILAELSGGMDSSSIVCLADKIIAQGLAETPRLDTLSFYNDSEPNWDERPYFMSVEKKRGRSGCHIDVQFREGAEDDYLTEEICFLPFVGPIKTVATNFAACLNAQGNRVLLSGIGGDEALGGVPTPTPELANLMVACHFRQLTRRLMTWALDKRVPWFHLLCQTIADFLPGWMYPGKLQPPDWLRPEFVDKYRAALGGYRKRLKFFAAAPSFQANLSALEGLRRQLNCSAPSPESLCEVTYPYLDRDLLQFLYGLPPEQLVRPGQRRSLMRRALVNTVPAIILNRRRKAFVARNPVIAMQRKWLGCLKSHGPLLTANAGIIQEDRFLAAIQRASIGDGAFLASLTRAIALEVWMRQLNKVRGSGWPGVPMSGDFSVTVK